jgi:hypothetical protein
MSQGPSQRAPFFPMASRFDAFPAPSISSSDLDSGYLGDDELADQSFMMGSQLCNMEGGWWCFVAQRLRGAGESD